MADSCDSALALVEPVAQIAEQTDGWSEWRCALAVVVAVAISCVVVHVWAVVRMIRERKHREAVAETEDVQHGPAAPLEDQLGQAIETRSMELTTAGVNINSHVIVSMMALRLVASVIPSLIRGSDASKRILTTTGFLPALLWYLFVGHLARSPGRILGRMQARLLYILGLSTTQMMGGFVQVSMMEFMSVGAGKAMMRFMLAAMFSDPKVTLVCNMATWGVDVAKYYSLYMNLQNNSDHKFPNEFACGEVLQVFLATAISAFVTYMIDTEVRAKLASNNDAKALESMLAAKCDCTIKLNRELFVQNENAKFASLLGLLGRTFGVKFLDFVAGDDEQEKVRKHLDETFQNNVKHMSLIGSIPPAKPLRTVLLGEEGPVQVEIFHTCSLGLNGGVTHLLGISEVPMEKVVKPNGMDEGIQDAEAMQRRRATATGQQQEGARSNNAALNAMMMKNVVIDEFSNPSAKPRASFDAFTEHLDVLAANDPWLALCGEPANLMEWMGPAPFPQFAALLEPKVNKAKDDEWAGVELSQIRLGVLKFQSPIDKRWLKAWVSVSVSDPLIGFDEDKWAYSVSICLEKVIDVTSDHAQPAT